MHRKICSESKPHLISLQVKLRACQAIYLGADDIHAYISGQLMECMASSDNVINGGFTTNEPRDEALLAKSLNYDNIGKEAHSLGGVHQGGQCIECI